MKHLLPLFKWTMYRDDSAYPHQKRNLRDVYLNSVSHKSAMASSKISSLFSCFLAFLLIANGASARLLGNFVAMINLDVEDHKVIHDKSEAIAENSFPQAPASAPVLQPSQLSQAKEAHAPAPAPDSQFHSVFLQPSTVATEMGTQTKPDCDDADHDGDDEDSKVTGGKPEASAKSSFPQAPASAPALQPSLLSQAKEAHAPAPAPDNQFRSVFVQPSTDAATKMGTETKPDCNDKDQNDDDDKDGDGK